MRGGSFPSGRSVSLPRTLRNFSGAKGFTIIEAIIVMAVTAALFVSAVAMISGRQNQTAFDQALRQVQSQIQQVANEVATGYYPNRNDFQCTAGAAGQPPSLATGSAGQGTNSACIFLGRAIQFGVQDTFPEQFAIYTIAGLRDMGSCSTEQACLAAANPIAVAKSSPSHLSSNYPDITLNEQLQSGLKVARMWYVDGGADVEIGAIAFVNSLAVYDGGQIISGASSVNVIAIDGTALNKSKQETAEVMNSDGNDKVANGSINPSGGIFVCFESGTTEDYGIVKIGGDNRDLSVVLTTKDKGGASCTYP